MSEVFLPMLSLMGLGNNDAEPWLVAHFAKGVVPPFSFIYEGKTSWQFIKDWHFAHEARQLDDAQTEHIFTYTDPKTNLQVRCECVVFKDFPAVEWVLKFKNNGEVNTPIIESIQALDGTFMRKQKTESRRQEAEIVLHRALGSSAQRTDFAPVDEALKTDADVKLAPIGGRSSNTTAFPFFNLEFVGEGGVMIAIGWSGQWEASFVRVDDQSVQVKAGMELTHLKLYPGEQIRTPRILLLFWQGDDDIVGHNLFRRFIIAHKMPKRNGEPVTLPFACSASALYDESNDATEQNQIDFAKQFIPFGVEYLWIDAGWFEGRWPNGVGNWFIRKDGFPNGIRPVSEAIKQMGMKGLILWFEPERVYQGTWLDREHPDWVLRLPNNPNGLLNLGNEEARQWLTEHISGMIEREGISVYRQDFNMDSLPFWRSADEPDRQGITEIRHIEGLYAFWDELLKRHPDLLIDNCASGGRRIDLETVSRSVVLWRSDYQYFEPNGYQSHTYGISLWLPSTSTGSGYPEVYSFRSSVNNGLVLSWNPYQPKIQARWRLPFTVDTQQPFPVELAHRLADEFKKVRHFFFGDFYPLTPHSVADDVWIAYQFHREDLRAGMVLAFRRHQCPTATMRLKLRGLSPTARYELHFEDRSVKQVFTGKEIADGLEVTIETAPGSLLVTYCEVS